VFPVVAISGRRAACAKGKKKDKREETEKSGILHGSILFERSTSKQDYGRPSAKYISEVHYRRRATGHPQKKTSERFVRWLFRAECRSWHSLDSICLAGVNPTRVIDLALVAILQSL
jgi:hypothetical protein